MASAAPAFRLDELPAEARDTVFGALLRRDAARACCVSKGWRDSFGAPHLWATLDFTDEAAFRVGERGETKAERRPLTAATVLGACRAARGALTHVTLPQTREMLALLPQLAAALPLLRRVTLFPLCDMAVLCGGRGAWGWATAEINGVLSLLHRNGNPPEEFSLGAEVGLLEDDQEHADVMALLLNDASPLQLTELRVHSEVVARNAQFAAVMRAHAHTLRSVNLAVYSRLTPGSVFITPYLENLCACRTLEMLRIRISDLRGLRDALQGAHPFAAVAAALREAGTLRKLELPCYTHQFSAGDDGVTLASLLLPGLTHLEIGLRGGGNYPVAAASESDFGARCVSSLAHALRHNNTLRTLVLHNVRDLHMPGDAPDGGQAGAQDAAQHHLDGRPLLPLCAALPTTQLRRLELEIGPRHGLCSLAALASALPPSLQELEFMDVTDDAVWTLELPLLLTAVHGLPRISKLAFHRGYEDQLLTAESLNACAHMLLHPNAAPQLLRTLSLGSCVPLADDACLVIADALWNNTTLTELKLYDVKYAVIGAFGAVLQRNASLRSLTLTLTVTDGPIDDPLLVGALASLRTGLQHNVTLQALMLDLYWLPPDDDDEDDEPDPWTLAPLAAALEALKAAGAEHPTCTLRIDTQYA